MDIGKRVYFDIKTGEVIFNTGERSGAVVPLTPQEEIPLYKVLADRVEGTYSWIDFTYGAHREEESLGGIISRIDLLTKKPIFKYPDLTGGTGVTPENPFDTIRELKTRLDLQDAYLAELTMYIGSFAK